MLLRNKRQVGIKSHRRFLFWVCCFDVIDLKGWKFFRLVFFSFNQVNISLLRLGFGPTTVSEMTILVTLLALIPGGRTAETRFVFGITTLGAQILMLVPVVML